MENKWQKIKTAPVNKWILAYAGKARYQTIFIAWKNDDGSFDTEDKSVLSRQALTHWMPLPEPPTKEN